MRYSAWIALTGIIKISHNELNLASRDSEEYSEVLREHVNPRQSWPEDAQK